MTMLLLVGRYRQRNEVLRYIPTLPNRRTAHSRLAKSGLRHRILIPAYGGSNPPTAVSGGGIGRRYKGEWN